jgi:mannose/fructose/N-acetylgalactosamine-specific phosphotransferase system component IIC
MERAGTLCLLLRSMIAGKVCRLRPGDMRMLTGIAVGAGIMLTYLALFGFAGRKLRSVDHDASHEQQEAVALHQQNRR